MQPSEMKKIAAHIAASNCTRVCCDRAVLEIAIVLRDAYNSGYEAGRTEAARAERVGA